MLSWQNITVQQFQDVYRLSENKNLDDMQRLEKVIAILFDKTEKQVEEMTIAEFTDYSKQCAFMLNTREIPGKPVKYIKINGRRYFIEHHPKKLMAKMRHRQYVESIHFSDDMIGNIHYLMASLVQPVKWLFIKKKNTANKHEAIASDMLHARFIDVYHTSVFFCKLYRGSIAAIKDYLKDEMTKMNMNTEAMIVQQALQNVMDGFSQQAR